MATLKSDIKDVQAYVFCILSLPHFEIPNAQYIGYHNLFVISNTNLPEKCHWFQEQLSASVCAESNTTEWEASGKDHQRGWICQKGVYSHPQQWPRGSSHHSEVSLYSIHILMCSVWHRYKGVIVYCYSWSGCLEVWPLSSPKGRTPTTVFAKVSTLMTT